MREQVDKMKEDGTFTKIYKKWFKEDPPDSLFNTNPDESANTTGSGGGTY